MTSVDRPVNVLLLARVRAWPSWPSWEYGRISVGGSLAYATFGALVDAGRELLAGSPKFWELAAKGRDCARASFGA